MSPEGVIKMGKLLSKNRNEILLLPKQYYICAYFICESLTLLTAKNL
jgi:hypothetical protein